MNNYTADERAEFEAIQREFANYSADFSPLANYHAIAAHFTMRKLREVRGYDFRAAEAKRLRMRLAEIDREVMTKE